MIASSAVHNPSFFEMSLFLFFLFILHMKGGLFAQQCQSHRLLRTNCTTGSHVDICYKDVHKEEKGERKDQQIVEVHYHLVHLILLEIRCCTRKGYKGS